MSISDEEQKELLSNELVALSDHSYLIRKALLRFEQAMDSLDTYKATLLRLETKIENIERILIKEEDVQE